MYSTSVYINTVKDVIPDITIWVFGSVMSDRKECTMIRSFKKAIWFLLAFSFIMGAATLTAFADSHDGWTAVTGEDDLAPVNNIIEPDNYYLDQNIPVRNTLIVQSGTVRICLHGHTLSSSETWVIHVDSGAELIIEDCSGGDGVIFNSKYHGLEVFGGKVRLINGRIEAAANGVIVNRGSLLVSGGKIKGSNNGIYIAADGSTDTTIKDGVVTGLMCGIKVDQGHNTLTITNGMVEAGNTGLPCIDAPSDYCKVTIKGGKFGGRFDAGMKVDVTGGYYKSSGIEKYVPDGYICRLTGKSNYPYMVGEKRLYVVIFSDGAGKMLTRQNVYEGDGAKAPKVPSRKGYRFLGWDREFNKISGESMGIMINALWQKKKIVKELTKVEQFKVYSGERKIIFNWKKANTKERKKFDYYEIQYGRKKNFKGAKTIYVRKNARQLILKNLKKNKKYYVRIRKCKEDEFEVHVSKWIKKSVKTK